MSEAVRELGTLPALDAPSIRARVCDLLMGLDHAGTVFCWRPLATSAGPRAIAITTRGGDSLASFARVFENDFASIAAEVRSFASTYNPALVRHRETQHFLELNCVVDREKFFSSQLHLRHLAPRRIVDQQRLLVYHGEEFLGWIGFMRHQGEGVFTPLDRRFLNPLVPSVVDALTAAARLDAESCLDAPGDFLLRSDGSIEAASRNGAAWLDLPDFREQLRRKVCALDGSTTEVCALPPQAEARIVRVDGSEGVRYLVNARRAPVPRRPPTWQLTLAQREVALLASSGASLPDIAGYLGVSLSTVRTHLRTVYRLLDVSSRAELASAVGASDKS